LYSAAVVFIEYKQTVVVGLRNGTSSWWSLKQSGVDCTTEVQTVQQTPQEPRGGGHGVGCWKVRF